MILVDLLGNRCSFQSLKGHSLWSEIGGFRSVFMDFVFHDSLLVSACFRQLSTSLLRSRFSDLSSECLPHFLTIQQSLPSSLGKKYHHDFLCYFEKRRVIISFVFAPNLLRCNLKTQNPSKTGKIRTFIPREDIEWNSHTKPASLWKATLESFAHTKFSLRTHPFPSLPNLTFDMFTRAGRGSGRTEGLKKMLTGFLFLPYHCLSLAWALFGLIDTDREPG